MRDTTDFKTLDILPAAVVRRGRGRPRVDNPLSAAARVKAYRARVSKKVVGVYGNESDADAQTLVLALAAITKNKIINDADRVCVLRIIAELKLRYSNDI